MTKIQAKWVNVTSGGMTTTIKTSSFTAADANIYLVNTTSGAVSIQLPAPALGLQFVIKDSKQKAATNAITLVRYGTEKIEEVAASYIMNETGKSITVVSDGTDWYFV